jgi:ubiquinone/menaquinone biosynthesis C-methylase UbiE
LTDAAPNETAERQRWAQIAAGWRERADVIRDFGMPVSARMIEQLRLQPGQRVLELAAGPGDTGFLAAELVRPGGLLISSDAIDEMLAIARERASAMGIDNVEFKLLELDWIDLETASVDAILCRWGLMFASDPAGALQEMRRVTRPGGRVALAVWDVAEENAWATIPSRALVELGYMEPPDPAAPGMFVLADADRLECLLEGAGFVDVVIERVAVTSADGSVEGYLADSAARSRQVREVREQLSVEQWDEVFRRVRALAEPYTAGDGSVRMKGRSLVASADA